MLNYPVLKELEPPTDPGEVYIIQCGVDTVIDIPQYFNDQYEDFLRAVGERYHIKGSHDALSASEYLKNNKPKAVFLVDLSLMETVEHRYLLGSIQQYVEYGGGLLFVGFFCTYCSKTETLNAFFSAWEELEWRDAGGISGTYRVNPPFSNRPQRPSTDFPLSARCIQGTAPLERVITLADIKEFDTIPKVYIRGPSDMKLLDNVELLASHCCTDYGAGHLVWVGGRFSKAVQNGLILLLLGLEKEDWDRIEVAHLKSAITTVGGTGLKLGNLMMATVEYLVPIIMEELGRDS